MLKFDDIKNVYFIGIGGIGMSALARYFASQGISVAGYDRTATELTSELEKEGIKIHYTDSPELLPENLAISDSLIIYTPAIPSSHGELNTLISRGFKLHKRSEVLGIICKSKRTIAVSGTHGKTSVSTITAHIIKNSGIDCSAFLGGISKNYDTNLLLGTVNSQWLVAEADEYDRSFLQIKPELAVITSMDADHLDIYNSHENIIQSFGEFVSGIEHNGALVYKNNLEISGFKTLPENIYSYSITGTADFQAINIKLVKGFYHFDIKTPDSIIENVILNFPGLLNVENSVAAASLAYISGVSAEGIRDGLATYKGVKRRFDIHLNTDQFVLIDDYAHHPEELSATIKSVREIYSGRVITGVFQPHLFSRTNDFADEFARSLDLLDEIVLLDIYPAREEPMKGVTSELILNKIQNIKKTLIQKEMLPVYARSFKPGIVIMMGAGDIDTFVDRVKDALINYENI